MFRTFSIPALGAAAVAVVLTTSGPAYATLALTPDGVADGFVLSTFVSGYSFGPPFSVDYGPLAQGILPNGNVVTGSFGDAKIYVFKDTDGQTLASAVSATPYTFGPGNGFYAMTTAGGQAYGAQQQGGPYELFHTDGSHAAIPGLTATSFLGMWGDPVNGHIIASANQGLIDINPVAGTFRVITGNPGADGVSVSPDGTILYASVGGSVIDAYNIATGALLHTYSANGHSSDGTGVISDPGGKFDGFIVVNNNDGTVGLIDPTLGTEDIIASGGSRGDWVSPDTSNGTLFLSQIEEVARLSCGPGCSIGGPPPTGTPEPASLALLGTAILAFGGLRHRKRR